MPRPPSASCLTNEELTTLAQGAAGVQLLRAEKHLESCEHCRTAFTAIWQDVTTANPELLRSFRPLPGTRIGRYQVIRKLGTGGMGVVVAALDPSLGREVAIKVLSVVDGPGSEELLERFGREARVTAQLQHKNLVPLYEAGELAKRPYLVMKRIDGERLDVHVRRRGGTLNVKETRPIIRQLCQAVAFVHSKQVVHRDIKPANVMVDAEGHVTLLDLGIARHSESQLTQTGTAIGTPQYMAPEQLWGFGADHRADIHALGVLLFEVMCGVHPYHRGDTPAVMRAIVKEPPPMPRSLVPSLPPPVERVILRALVKEPEHRIQDANALWKEFELATADAYSATVLGGPIEPAAKPVGAGKASSHEAKTIMAGGDTVALRRPSQSEIPVAKAPTKPGNEVHLEIVVQLDGAPGDAFVEIDGKRRVAPVTLTLDPGERSLTVHRPGYTPVTKKVTFFAGQRVTLNFNLKKV